MTYYIGKTERTPVIPKVAQLWKHETGTQAFMRVEDEHGEKIMSAIGVIDIRSHFVSVNLTSGCIVVTRREARDIVILKCESCVFVPE